MNAAAGILWLQLVGLLALEISIVVGGALALRCVLPSPAWRRTLWQVAFIAIIALTLLEISGFARLTTRSERVSPQPPAQSASAPHDRRITLPLQTVEPEQLRLSPDFRRQVESRLGHRDQTAGVAAPMPVAAKEESLRTVSICALIWVAGAVMLLGRILFGHILLLRHRARSRDVTDPGLREQIELLTERLKIRGRIRVTEVPGIGGPVAFGVCRRGIGLPPRFLDRFSPQHQQVMLAHEMAHLAARDPAWQLAVDCVASFWWWHPLVWWARRQLHAESESAADEASLLFAEGPNDLAECLVALGSQLRRGRSPASAGIGGNGFRSNLGKRVERLLSMGGQVWQPPQGRVINLAKAIGPAVIVAVALYSTTWAAPQVPTQETNTMKSIQRTWRSSLAAAVLFAAAEATPPTTAQEKPRATTSNPFVSTADSLSTPSAPAATPSRMASPAVPGLETGTRAGQPPSGAVGAAAETPREATSGRRGAMSRAVAVSNRTLVQQKLDEIVIAEAFYDGLPILEVLRSLSQESRRQDPEQKGMNFILNPHAPSQSSIDPATGLPIVGDPIDLSSVTVKFHLPLYNLRLSDLLDVIARVADRPIKFTVEDYGVVVALAPTEQVLNQVLLTKTFRVEAEIFFKGMEAAFGVKLPPISGDAAASAPARRLQELKLQQANNKLIRAKSLAESKLVSEAEVEAAEIALATAQAELAASNTAPTVAAPSQAAQQKIFRELLSQLGVKLDPPKSVFYNDLTGIVMVRVLESEMGVVEAAIETLGGKVAPALAETGKHDH